MFLFVHINIFKHIHTDSNVHVFIMSDATNVFVTDYDYNEGINSCFRSAVKCCNYHYHVSFLEACKVVGACPGGLVVDKKPFISFISHELVANLEDTIQSTQSQLLDTLIIGIYEKFVSFQNDFWQRLYILEEEVKYDVFEEWLVKLVVYIENLEKRVLKRKKVKLHKLVNSDESKQQIASNRMDDHTNFFNFKKELYEYVDSVNKDLSNLINLVLLGSPSHSDKSTVANSTIMLEQEASSIETLEANNSNNNMCENIDDRFKGKFVSENVINLSGRDLSKAEISLLSKGLKFVPTPTNVNKAILKEELEKFGRRLRLKWHFRNEDNIHIINPFKKKSKFNPKWKDVAIEYYLSRLEEDILAIDTKLNYANLTREEREALKTLRDDTSIVIKEADKGSAVVVWDREDYLKEADRQLKDPSVYQEMSGDFVSPLIRTIKHHLSNVKLNGDVGQETLDYFINDNPRIGRFYMLPKIHKRLHSVPGRPVISNCSYFTENISAFLDHHLQPLAKKVNSYIKDTNDFLKKLRDLPNLPEDFLLCTVDVVGLYPNIPHEDGLAALKKHLEKREEKPISTNSLLELTECVLKNNIFEHNESYFKQIQGTAIGTKMAPPYAILFMSELEETFLASSPLKPFVWWRYIDDIFMI